MGGSAIEIYTSGEYVSDDVDVVGNRRALVGTLEKWGFRRKGRVWYRPELNLWVDPVGMHYAGDEDRLREVSTPYGQVKLAAVEDLIAKRLIETKVWPRSGSQFFDQAAALAAEYTDGIDWDYVTRVARRDLADDLVPELRRRAIPTARMHGSQR
ncbi:MAG: hypothetical protein WCB18_10160 [Thermoplasmata archaeon]